MLLHYPVKHLMSAKQAINDKLQGSVATYLSCGGVVNKQIKKSLLLSLWVNFLKSVSSSAFRFQTIWFILTAYKQ